MSCSLIIQLINLVLQLFAITRPRSNIKLLCFLNRIIVSPQKEFGKDQESVEYIELVKIFAYNCIKNLGELDINQKSFLLVWDPSYAILCMLDKIFDYMDIEDLQKMTCVSKLFCFAATLERHYDKFEQKFEPNEKPVKPRSKRDLEADQIFTACLSGLAQRQGPHLAESTLQIIRNNSNHKSCMKVKKVPLFKKMTQKNQFLLDTILEGSELESSDEEWNIEDSKTYENLQGHSHYLNSMNKPSGVRDSAITLGSNHL